MNEVLNYYLEDLKDQTIALNESLIKLESQEIDKELMDSLFRVAHTIKGNSATMEFMNIQKVMHRLEDVLQNLRSGKLEYSKQVLDLLYAGHDFLEDCAAILPDEESDGSIVIEPMLEKIRQFESPAEAPVPAAALSPKEAKAKEKKEPAKKASGNKKARMRFESLGISIIDKETLEIMGSNLQRGAEAYRLIIRIDPECPMKSVRQWIIYDKIDGAAVHIASQPPRPEEDAYKESAGQFEEDQIMVFLLIEGAIEELLTTLRNEMDILEVTSEKVEMDDISYALSCIAKDPAEEGAKASLLALLEEADYEMLSVICPSHEDAGVQAVAAVFGQLANVEYPEGFSTMQQICRKLWDIFNTAQQNHRELPGNFIHEAGRISGLLTEWLKTGRPLEANAISSIHTHFDCWDQEISTPQMKIGEALAQKGLLNEEHIETIVALQKSTYQDLKFGQIAVKENIISASQVRETVSELKNQHAEKGPCDRKSEAKTDDSFIRVPVTKVDSLMDMLGELLILNSQIDTDICDSVNCNPALLNKLSRVSKIIRETQALSMSLRMVEIKPTFHRLTRIVRETAAELDKAVSVTIEGDDTEIDRSASEKIFDPLMHLVRNAVSHGIEVKEERAKTGKDPEGRVFIRAYNKKGSVYIDVADDGRGMDSKKILQKARDLKLAEETKEYSEEEILDMIFLPGFSTQEEVNTISGRGVGMNVVKSELKKLGGKVIIDNRPGEGCTFTIRLPMNLAVVNGTIVQLMGLRYIVPTLFIKEFFIADQDSWIAMQGNKRAIKVRDKIVPLTWGHKILEIPEEEAGSSREVVIMEVEQRLLAIPVDRIIGRQELISKPLSGEFSAAKYFTSAAILGDGEVALILDVEAIFKNEGI